MGHKRKVNKKVIWGMMATIGLLSVASAAANTFISSAPFIGDVTTVSPGAEVIIPLFIDKDADGDGLTDRVLIRYDIYQNNSTIKLYSSDRKTALYPASPCTNPPWQDTEFEPMFVRSGKWMITGMVMEMGCYSQENGDLYAENTFIYMADVSIPGGEVRSKLMKGTYLNGLDLLDYNDDGKDDLMVSTIIPKTNGENIRIYFMDIDSGEVLSDQTYVVAKH
jgi:hypothetical protein